MSIQAKLFIDDLEVNALKFHFSFSKQADANSRPTNKTVFDGLTIEIEVVKALDLEHWAIARNQTKKLELHILSRVLGGKTRKLILFDCHLLGLKFNFSDKGTDPMIAILNISCGGVKDSNSTKEYSAYWRTTFDTPDLEATKITQNPTPTIRNINWIHPETKKNLKETTYKGSIALTALIENQESSSVTITITKEDETEFENGQKELTFEESVTENGTIELTSLEIKEQWEEFKTADVDKIVAKIDNNGYQKKSSALQIVPSPKLIVEFRPHKNWKGEYGFDWIRKNDTTLFGDNKYEDVISKQYTDNKHTKLEKDSNNYKGYFKKDTKQFEDLKKKYKSFTLPWSKKDKAGKQNPENYRIPWMSLLNGEEAEINIITTIEQQADYIEFDNNPNFLITPNKIDITGKTKIEYKDNITVKIKCKQEFTTDQILTIKAYKKAIPNPLEVGKIQVWANDKTKQKEKKVVFVQIKTPELIPTNGEKIGYANSEKTRINNYIKQALISLHKDSNIITLDLTTDKDFLKFVTTNNTINYTNKKDADQLHDFLKTKLKTDFKDKYKDYFKAFYFGESGGGSGGLSGYSQPGQEYVVVFNSANDQTASHEFLHALNLTHSFANKEADKDAEFTYKYKQTENLLDYSHHISGHKNDRCSLWYWQWVKANNSI